MMTDQHPVTLYGFVTGVVALIGIIVLIATGDVSADVGVPIVSAIGLGGVGAAAGVARQSGGETNVTGTVTTVTPDE